jgi:hypothetical protein
LQKRAGGLAQGVGPEFKCSSAKKKKNRQTVTHRSRKKTINGINQAVAPVLEFSHYGLKGGSHVCQHENKY